MPVNFKFNTGTLPRPPSPTSGQDLLNKLGFDSLKDAFGGIDYGLGTKANPIGGATNPEAPPPSSGNSYGQQIWDALNAYEPGKTDWVDLYKDAILALNDPAYVANEAKFAQPGYFTAGSGHGLDALAIREAVDPTMGAVYNRQGSGGGGENDYAAFWAPFGFAGSSHLPGVKESASSGLFDKDGRYIGQKSGFLPDLNYWIF